MEALAMSSCQARNCRHRALNVATVIACALLLCVIRVQAQQSTADVIGTVTDASGGVLPGATVTLTNTDTNISRTTETTGSGDYTFTLVQVGTYSIKVEAKGFKTFLAPSLAVASGDRARVDAPMEVGDVTQSVEVQATVAPALQTDTSSLGTLVTSQAVEDVPLDGRNVTKLVQLSVGVTEGRTGTGSIVGGGRPDDRRQTDAFSVNGQDDALNNNMIDGMDNNERIIGGNVARPSVDAIQEVNVSTNLYTAEVGRTGGGVVDVITKSGSNNVHGSAYEFFRNAVLNTNPGYAFPANGSGGLTTVLAKPAFRQNQYGASLGGPIKKDKTFFFGDFEQYKRAIGQPMTISVPTLCERGLTLAKLQGYTGSSVTCPDGNPTTPGDFSDISAISALGGSSTPGPANSGVDLSNIGLNTPLNKQGLEYFSMFPLPNGPGTQNNFSSAPMNTQKSTTIDGRIDQHISNNDTFYGRYSINDVNTLTPTAFPLVHIDPATGLVAASGVTGVPVIPGQGNGAGPALERQQSLGLSYVHIFNANLILNLKAGYLRSSIRSLPPNQGTNVSNALGFPCNTSPNIVSPFGSCINMPGQVDASGLETVSLAVASPASASTATPTYTGFGDSGFIPDLEFDNTFTYSGAVTWTKGAQSIKIGLGLVRRRATIAQSVQSNGSVAFSGVYTGVPAADLLEGLSTGGVAAGAAATLRSNTLVSPGYRMWEPSVYIQDDWRARRWLTLNLGMRYDIFTPFTEVHGRIANYNPATGLVVSPSLPGAQQSSPTGKVKTDYFDIAPRLGFAATLKHDLVVRGGFGLSFFPINYQSTYTLKNAPFNYQYNCSLQQVNNSQSTCTGTPYANANVAHYGTVPNPGTSSSVGQTGGYAFSAGLPVPFVNYATVVPPTPAQCSFTTLAAYSPTPTTGACPSVTDPYQNFGLTAIINPNLTAEYLEQANLQIQKAFGENVITIGAVTELGRRVPKALGLNVISNPTQVVGGSNVPPLAAQFPWLAKTTVTQSSNTANSAYNAMQATFVRRFSKGLTVQFNYTWDHARTFTGGACTPTATPTTINPCFYDNVKNPASPIVVPWFNKGFSGSNSGYDVADRFAWTVNYQLPFGKSMSGLKGEIVKGWTTNLAGSWQTGLPFTVGENAANINGIGGTGNPDQICSGRAAHPTLLQWFNPSCFQSQTPGTFGNELGGQLFGPAQRKIDFSLFKEFPVKEGIRVQFRAEVFNLFNTPNFNTPSGLTVQYTGCNVNTTRCTAIQNTYPTGAITGLDTNIPSREIQFALKLLFLKLEF